MELVRRAQAGDREAFEVLVERHAAEIYRLSAAIVNEFDARDIAQESFVAAWTTLPNLRDPEAFQTWLRRICVNRCRNWLRSSRRRPSSSLDADDLAPTLADARPDFRIASEARAVLEPAFESLTAGQRTLLALHYAMGYSIAEAAEILDIRVGTAKSRLNAGLKTLRGAINPPATDSVTEGAS